VKPGTVKLIAALCTTLMDLTVIGNCGPLLWKVWGDFCWPRIGLLLLAGAIAFTLMDIWAKTLAPAIKREYGQIHRGSEKFSSAEVSEVADV